MRVRFPRPLRTKSPPDVKSPFWPVFVRQRHALCSNSCDRIYSLLGIASDGDTIKINYGETTLATFRRLADQLQLWAMPLSIRELLEALELSREELIDEIEYPKRLHYSIPMRSSQIRTSVGRKTKCDYKNGDMLYSANIGGCSSGEVLLCSFWERTWVLYDFHDIHAVLKPSGTEQDATFTILLQIHLAFYPRLDDLELWSVEK